MPLPRNVAAIARIPPAGIGPHRVCTNRAVALRGAPDGMRGVTFPYARVVVMDACDKNFVYYHLRPETFPSAEAVVLHSHPCEATVLYRFPGAAVYVTEHWFESVHWLRRTPARPVDTVDYRAWLADLPVESPWIQDGS